jgi:hypothetical protein
MSQAAAPLPMVQAKLDAQGRIQSRAAAGPVKEEQAEPTKRPETAGEKKGPTTRVTTRGAAADMEALTREEIRDLPVHRRSSGDTV